MVEEGAEGEKCRGEEEGREEEAEGGGEVGGVVCGEGFEVCASEVVADDEHGEGRVEFGEHVDGGGEDGGEAERSEEEGEAECEADGAGVDEGLGEGVGRGGLAASGDEAPAPDDEVEGGDVDDAEEDAFIAEDGLFERDAHEAGVGEDDGEA